VSVDASMRVLKKNNLKPHLVTSLERVIETAKLFEGLTKEDVKDVYLAACPVIREETYANFPGERIIVYRNFATFKWLELEKGTLNIGASSANMAFKILTALGCNPIILIGQDLAFGEDDKTHAKGTTYGEKSKTYVNSKNILEVPGNYKEKVKTTGVWYRFLKAYEVDIREYNGKVINATEGGAKIAGTEIMTFKEAIEQYITDEFNPLKVIKDNLNYPTKEEIEKNRNKTIKKVENAIKYCNDVINEFDSGYKFCIEFTEKVTKKYQNKEQINHEIAKDLFNKSQKPLNKMQEKDFFEIIMHYVQSYYIRTMVEINGIKVKNIEPTEQNIIIIHYLKDMYAVMIELIKKMIAVFNEMEKKLK
jgi:hypothetical protein